MAANLSDFAAALRAASSEPMPSRLVGLPIEEVAWLCLAPAWPLALARESFPGPQGQLMTGDAVERELRELEKRGLVDFYAGEAPWSGPWCTMNRQQRSIVANELLQFTPNDPEYLARTARNAAIQMRKAARDQPLPRTLEQWAELVEPGLRDGMADLLDARVAGALQASRDAGQPSCPEAAKWIETAEPLADILAGNLVVAVARSVRRLDLFQRQSVDERFLGNYQPRKEQEQAFVELLEDGQAWALNLVGYGGVGKTMLVRHLKTGFAREHGLATARLDFDNLNPNYPARAPGLLLMGFAEELRLNDDPAVAKSFVFFDNAIRSVHSKLEGAFRSGSSGAIGGVATGFETAKQAFCEALGLIAERSQPLLILDTCEELAKLRNEQNLPEALLRTFDLLKDLHDAVPSLRVVFAGRRILASEGSEWSVPQSQLPVRKYLRLMEVRGFDREEAEGFLANYSKDGLGVKRELWPSILKQAVSRESPALAHVVWKSGHRAAGVDGPRYNPFDLDLLAAWAATSTGPGEMQEGANVYIRDRIAGRLESPLHEYLPDLAIMGRFDREMFELLTGFSGEACDLLWEKIRSQEWIDVDRSARANGEVYLIEQHLRERILSYYQSNAMIWNAARQRVRPVLGRITLERQWSDLDHAYFLAAMDVMGDYPVKAADWWAEVERKIARDGVWDWARDITSPLLDTNDPANLRQTGLYAAVAATSCSAALRFTPSELGSMWEEVLTYASLHPTEPGRALLAYRARAGIIAAIRRQLDPPDESYAGKFEELLGQVPEWNSLPAESRGDEQAWATEVALIENCVEVLERIDWRLRPPASLLEKVTGREEQIWRLVPRQWAAFLRMLLLRTLEGGPVAVFLRILGLRALEGGPVKGEDWIAAPDPPQTDWLDWRRESDLGPRIRLEQARLNRWSGLAPPTAVALPNPDSPFNSLDEERLSALQLLTQLDHSVPEISDAFIKQSLSVAARPPECQAHRAVPPYFAVALEVKALQGDVAAAVRALQDISADTQYTLDVRQAADRALLRIAARYRLLDSRESYANTLAQSVLLSDSVQGAGANAYNPVRNLIPFVGRWRESINYLSREGHDPHVAPSTAPTATFAEFSLALDWTEAALSADGPAQVDISEAALAAWRNEHPRRLVESFTLTVRARAIEGQVAERDVDLPLQRAAEILFEEGGLLALNMPMEAVALLSSAAARFELSHDAIGAAIAGIARAMCYARSGNLDRLQHAVGKFNLRALGAQTDGPPSGWQTGHFDTAMAPWLVRAGACQARAMEFAKPGPETEALMAKLAERFAGGYPLDLSDVLAAEGLLVSETITPNTKTARRLETLRNIGYFVAGSSAIWGMVIACQRLLGFLHVHVTQIQTAGLLLAAGTVGAALPSVWRFYVQAMMELMRISVDVSPVGPVSNPNRPLESRVQLKSTMRFLRWPFRERTSELGPIRDGPYAEQANQPDRSINLRTAWPMSWYLTARVDPSCAAAPLEALLAYRGRPLTKLAQTQVVMRRSSGSRSLTIATKLAAPMRVRWWAYEMGHRGSASTAWATLPPDRFTVLRGPPGTEADHILHITANAVEDSGGLILRLSRALAETSREGSSQGSSQGGNLGEVSPDRLAASSPQLRLCVLQGFAETTARRLGTDRYAANLMRRAASILFKGGIPAVIVIPPLPEPVAGEVLNILVAAIRRTPRRGVAALVSVVRDMQKVIAAKGNSDAASALEMAYDVCFYAISDISFRPEAAPDTVNA
jgi:hypothetical protein